MHPEVWGIRNLRFEWYCNIHCRKPPFRPLLLWIHEREEEKLTAVEVGILNQSGHQLKDSVPEMVPAGRKHRQRLYQKMAEWSDFLQHWQNSGTEVGLSYPLFSDYMRSGVEEELTGNIKNETFFSQASASFHVALPVLGMTGGAAFIFFICLNKITEIIKSTVISDLCDRGIGGGKLIAGMLNPLIIEIIDGGPVCHIRKETAEILW